MKKKKKRKRKSATEDADSAHGDHEQQIKKITLELADMHGVKYNDNQFKFRARMMVNKQHDDMDHPPNIPLITGGVKKHARKESLTDAISGAATAFVKALASHRASPQKPPQHCVAATNTGVSPSSKAQLSGQYIEQFKSLQELRESGVLSEEEFEEQKTFAALQNIRRLNKLKHITAAVFYHRSYMYDHYIYIYIYIYIYMWQSCVEIKGYSVAYFDRIAAFEVPYR